MDLKKYFEETDGFGVLSTADREGRVDSAVYAKPHVIDENTVAFVTGEKLTHANLQENPYAVYLFKEEGPGYMGSRVFLKKERESGDQSEVQRACREAWPAADAAGYCERGKYIVYFKVQKVLPLSGAGEK